MTYESLGYEPCEARRPQVVIDATLRQMEEDGSTSTYRKVYMCGKPGRVYGTGEGALVLCKEHKHLAP